VLKSSPESSHSFDPRVVFGRSFRNSHCEGAQAIVDEPGLDPFDRPLTVLSDGIPELNP
jgi:hypothetical protein